MIEDNGDPYNPASAAYIGQRAAEAEEGQRYELDPAGELAMLRQDLALCRARWDKAASAMEGAIRELDRIADFTGAKTHPCLLVKRRLTEALQ